MKKTAIYARVSTTEQAEKELSIPAQIKELKEYAINNNMEIVNIYKDEGVSAKTDDRPEFQKMIAEAKLKSKPFDVILYHKNDRFARNREDAIVYKSLLRRDCGIELIAIKEDFGDGPVAKMIEGILEVIAEFYSLNLAQEVKKGMTEKAGQGKVLGETPLGYTVDENGNYKVVSDEAKVVQYIFNEYVNTDKGLRSIAIDLKTKGEFLFGEAGQKYKWSGNGIKVILNNKKYVGTSVWNKRSNQTNSIRDKEEWIEVENSHEAIIDKETFIKAQKTLKEKTYSRSNSRDYLLKGMVKCMDCGGSMSQFSYKWKRKDGTKMEKRALRCSNYMHTGECYFNNISMDVLEKIIIKNIDDYINANKKDNLILSKKTTDKNLKNFKKLEKDFKGLEKKFERQMIAYENEIINSEQLKEFKNRLNNEKAEIFNKILSLKEIIKNKDIETIKINPEINNNLSILKDKDKPIRKRIKVLKSIVDCVEYSKKNDNLIIHIID